MSCFAFGMTTSSSIFLRQPGSPTSFALLSYWPCFGLARKKEIRTRQPRNSVSVSRLSGFLTFIEPGSG
jgi:hypothetical protein